MRPFFRVAHCTCTSACLFGSRLYLELLNKTTSTSLSASQRLSIWAGGSAALRSLQAQGRILWNGHVVDNAVVNGCEQSGRPQSLPLLLRLLLWSLMLMLMLMF